MACMIRAHPPCSCRPRWLHTQSERPPWKWSRLSDGADLGRDIDETSSSRPPSRRPGFSERRLGHSVAPAKISPGTNSNTRVRACQTDRRARASLSTTLPHCSSTGTQEWPGAPATLNISHVMVLAPSRLGASRLDTASATIPSGGVVRAHRYPVPPAPPVPPAEKPNRSRESRHGTENEQR